MAATKSNYRLSRRHHWRTHAIYPGFLTIRPKRQIFFQKLFSDKSR
jgi:hypothetical protein